MAIHIIQIYQYGPPIPNHLSQSSNIRINPGRQKSRLSRRSMGDSREAIRFTSSTRFLSNFGSLFYAPFELGGNYASSI